MRMYSYVKWGFEPKSSQYLVWPPFASRSATHLLRIELIRLLIVACVMLVHSSSMSVWSCWVLAGTGTRCRIRRSRASQTCSMGDMSGWPCKNWDVFSFQELCTDPCIMGSCNIMLQHEVMVVDKGHINGPQDLVTLSAFKMPSIKSWATRSTTLTSSNRSPTRRHTRCLPSVLYSENQDSSMKRTPLQSARRHQMWAFAHSCPLRRLTAVRTRPRWGWRAADELPWDGLWQFVQKFFGYVNRLLQQLSGWLVSDDLGGEDAGCGGPGLVWLHVVSSC